MLLVVVAFVVSVFEARDCLKIPVCKTGDHIECIERIWMAVVVVLLVPFDGSIQGLVEAWNLTIP